MTLYGSTGSSGVLGHASYLTQKVLNGCWQTVPYIYNMECIFTSILKTYDTPSYLHECYKFNDKSAVANGHLQMKAIGLLRWVLAGLWSTNKYSFIQWLAQFAIIAHRTPKMATNTRKCWIFCWAKMLWLIMNLSHHCHQSLPFLTCFQHHGNKRKENGEHFPSAFSLLQMITYVTRESFLLVCVSVQSQ